MNSDIRVGDAKASRLGTLMALLDSDPGNLALLSDAAEVAIDDRAPDTALDLLARYAAIEPLPPAQCNLAGLAAMQSGDFEKAARHFRALIDAGVVDPSVRFNLAWSLATLKSFADANAVLDETVADALPQAAMLRIQLLHELGEIDTAILESGRYLRVHSDHPGLLAAVSVLALDAEDEALARNCADRAGDHPDAIITLGMLALGDGRAVEARDLFDRALNAGDRKPRGWIGHGLSRLLSNDAAGAALDFDRAAAMFGDHLGSWVAAGWAHFIDRDLETSRARFETALELDPTFAETHGSLAVLDLLAGDVQSASARCDIALRLDRRCYAGALAKSLLTAHAGDQETAQRIFDLAIATPVDGSGRFIGETLARMALQ